METEQEIAKRFLKLEKKHIVSAVHKESCERFLEFLEDNATINSFRTAGYMLEYRRKLNDLKNAIKEYKDNENT